MPKLDKKAHIQANILGVKIDSTNRNTVLDYAWENIQKKKPFFIITPNPEIVTLAAKDSEYRNILNSADIAICDGVGLSLAAKLLYQKTLQRVTGRALFEKLLALANEKQLKVYLLGSTTSIIAASTSKIKKDYPKLSIKGQSGPQLQANGSPRSLKNIYIEQKVIAEINAFKPDLLFVAFGAPKQERWVAHNRKRLKALGLMVVGGTLDTYSGAISAPPPILSRLGLEWLWRLLQEPKRIGRIATAVFKFPILVLKEKIESI